MTMTDGVDEAHVTVAHQSLIEKYLKKYTGFLDGHSRRLHNLLSDIDPSGSVKSPLKGGGYACDLIELTWSISSEENEPRVLEEVTSRIPATLLSGDAKNPEVEKVLLIMSTLVGALRRLREGALTEFVDTLLLYGEGGSNPSYLTPENVEGDDLLAISSFLPTLRSLDIFSANLEPITIHLLVQLNALFKDMRPQVVAVPGLSLPSAFRELGDILALLLTLDEVVSTQSVLQEHWSNYRRMVKSVRADSKAFGAQPERLAELEHSLQHLENRVMSGRLYWNMVDALVGEGRRIGVHKNGALSERFAHQLILMSQELEKGFTEGVDSKRSLSICALFGLSATLFDGFDVRRSFTRIWIQLQKVHAVHIGGALLWNPELFLSNLPGWKGRLLDSRALSAQKRERLNYLQQRMAKLSGDVLGSQIHIAAWGARLQEALCSKDLGALALVDLARRSQNIMEGVKFVQGLAQNFIILLNLHASENRPVTVQELTLFCQILELTKEVSRVFSRFNAQIAASAMIIIQHVTHIALGHVKSLKRGLEAFGNQKGSDEARTDLISALFVLENILFAGSPHPSRLILAKLSLEWVTSGCLRLKTKIRDDEVHYTAIGSALERIQLLINLQRDVQSLSNGSVMYWHRALLFNYFRSILTNPHEARKLPKMFDILQDCTDLVTRCSPHPDAGRAFASEVKTALKVELVEKLWRESETQLRLQSHTHLQQGGQSVVEAPFRTGVKDLAPLLRSSSIRFDGKMIHFKYLTEFYLSKTFYELASVALHDWQTYATMRAIANDRFGLEIVEDHLPGHTLEQGMDILGIVRNLGPFVENFAYNLNNQVFVQISSQNKHLDTLNIRHLANSMRSHGPGIANNTVNVTYHFLVGKIKEFSTFLYDEQIKSRLGKDIRLFRAGRQVQVDLPGGCGTIGPNSSFPYERALKFQRGIRKLGIDPEGHSPLDKFRILITHIGNALGFVRLVRSGGLHFSAGGTRFLPDIDDIPVLSHLSSEDLQLTLNLTQATDMALSSLGYSFSRQVDYFQLLVSAFSSALRNSKNGHLRHFFVIIPALTLSHVDYLRSSKEKCVKKGKGNAIFTDDGFPMGLAYLLRVLNQEEDWDSLGWFSGVQCKLEGELRREEKLLASSKSDTKLGQTSKLTAKRIREQIQEFQLLGYNLSSARIFFQSHSSTN